MIDQLFHSSEKRLAPRVSGRLAQMVGGTCSRMNLVVNKFRKFGFIEYNGGLRAHFSPSSRTTKHGR
jgi:CRP/FNR family cyclic AMP-dependent transcriptional regulator